MLSAIKIDSLFWSINSVTIKLTYLLKITLKINSSKKLVNWTKVWLLNLILRFSLAFTLKYILKL